MCRYCHQTIPVAAEGSSLPAATPQPKDFSKLWYCDHCGFIGQPRRYTKGSLVLEVFLYFLMIFPGIIYSLWRLTSKFTGCPKCATQNMMPATTPKAQAAITGKA